VQANQPNSKLLLETEPTAGKLSALLVCTLPTTQEFEVNPPHRKGRILTVFTEANQAQQSLAQVQREMETATQSS